MSPAHAALLLRSARAALEAAVHRGETAEIDEGALPLALRARTGAFVSLYHEGRLRGCIGRLEAADILVNTVVAAARDAALHDPRFPAVAPRELATLHIEVSVLSPLTALEARSRTELLAVLEPRRDGLLLREGSRQATFLPQVWDQLPESEAFLAQLLVKAGLPAQYWSTRLRCFRYTVESCAGSALSPS